MCVWGVEGEHSPLSDLTPWGWSQSESFEPASLFRSCRVHMRVKCNLLTNATPWPWCYRSALSATYIMEMWAVKTLTPLIVAALRKLKADFMHQETALMCILYALKHMCRSLMFADCHQRQHTARHHSFMECTCRAQGVHRLHQIQQMCRGNNEYVCSVMCDRCLPNNRYVH